MQRREFIAAALLVLLDGGCGRDGYADLGLVDVHGAVTLDGKPLPGAKVSFEAADLRQFIGVTDKAGRFRPMYDSRTAGVLPGLKIVRITTADANLEGGGLGEGALPGKEIVPERYNAKSELKADVSVANKTFNFELKSAP